MPTLDSFSSLQKYGDLFQLVKSGVLSEQWLAEAQSVLYSLLTPERVDTIHKVIEHRTRGVVPVLENIYDRGNVSAVMRSAEAFGFFELALIEIPGQKFKAANRVTKGTEKWLNTHKFASAVAAANHLRTQGYQIYATHLESATPLDEVDFSKPTALVYGNEKDGVSREMLDLADGSVIIPMLGFAQSFNISVAAAISMYHASCQRKIRLGQNGDLSPLEKKCLAIEYMLNSSESAHKVLFRELRL